MTPPGLALATIVSKNYLAYARVLAHSFRRHHPAGRVFVLLVDEPDGRLAPQHEPFELVPLGDLDIPDLRRFCFQYTILELNTAAKAAFLAHLLRARGVARLLYLDPDILVARELTELGALLDRHSIVLTPHLLEALDADGRKPSERDILNAGAYNLGFLALRADATTERFLDWWARRLYDGCIVDPAGGLFVDQRWIDLVPGMFDGVHVLRHPGYNVAYWNLLHRRIEIDGPDVRVNGQPLHFFHFSGFDPDTPEGVSRHQDRFSLDDLPELRPLFEEYRARLMAAGYEETRRWPYAFRCFDNGVVVHPLVRRMYRRLGDGVARFGDPFATGHRGSFWRWIHEETLPGSGVPRLWYEVYLSRADLRRVFPDVFGPHRAAFLAWTERHGRVAYAAGDAGAERGPAARPEIEPAAASVPGLNVAGYTMSEKGVGEALRATLTALAAAGIPHCVIDVPDPGAANAGGSLVGRVDDNPYPVNLIHLTAAELPKFVSARGPDFLRDRYNIGFWMWELDRFPRVFQGAFLYLDEVWVASTYCLDAISRASPIPVVRVPLPLSAERLRSTGAGRDHFGLPEDAVVFLFVFDAHSVLERKNPRAVIHAFRRAFKGQEDVRLVLKLSRGNRRIRDALAAEAADERVLVVDRVFGRGELNALVEASDCYVSLHRSEGFGLTMAEAMALGKPVIATAYSANMDFMNAGNGFLVRYDLVRLDRDYGPYPRGGVWADPSVEHASELMRGVYENPAMAAEVAARGRREIWDSLSPDAIGREIVRRLDVIGRRLDAARPAGGAAGTP